MGRGPHGGVQAAGRLRAPVEEKQRRRGGGVGEGKGMQNDDDCVNNLNNVK